MATDALPLPRPRPCAACGELVEQHEAHVFISRAPTGRNRRDLYHPTCCPRCDTDELLRRGVL